MNKFPDISTKRLDLTEITVVDTQALFELFSSADVVKYYDIEAMQSLSQAEKVIGIFESRYRSSSGIRWGLRLKSSSELIGTCGFNSWDGKMHTTSLGYDLKPEYWNNGMMTEAAYAVLEFAFSGGLPCGPINRVQADTVPGNVGSEKVLLKLGFKEEGLRRQCAYWKGSYHDLKCFGLLKSDFGAVPRPGGH